MTANRTLKALITLTLAVAGPAGIAAPAIAAPTHSAVVAHHACTHTSSGSCIRGGEFCRQAQYGQRGYDAAGRKYVCKGSHVHPHWEKP